MTTQKEKEEIVHSFERTINNCCYYEKENKINSLINEIGVLRGLAYAMEIVGLCPYNDLFLHFIEIQQKYKSEDK